MRRSLLVFVLSLAVTSAHAAPLKVVASFSILGDLVHQIGGDDVEVTTLVGPDGDAHTYEPTPADAKAIASADLVVVNGLGLDTWMDHLEQASGYKGMTVIATTGVVPMKSETEGVDPHAWQSVGNARLYGDAIEAALEKADPAHAEDYQEHHGRFEAELFMLDKEVRHAFAAIPEDQRVVITTHDAFGYYGRDYDIKFLAPEGISTESEASAMDVSKLITQIRQDRVKAVFIENMSDPRLIQRIAAEAGVDVSGQLYSDALSKPDGPAATYISMVRYNTRMLAAAMQENNSDTAVTK
jgi:zinc/manganese transport system substrate-binding protein